jgi:hypothetical protein
VPVKVGRVELPLVAEDGRTRLAGVAGYDLDDVLAARDQAVRSAVVLAASRAVPGTTLAAGELDLPEVPAAALVGHRGPVAGRAALVLARDLVGGEEHLVPAGAAFPRLGSSHSTGFEQTTLGVGVGTSWSAAAHDGLLSALALHGLERALAGEPVGLVTEEQLTDLQDLRFLVGTAGHAGSPPRLLVLPGEPHAVGVLAIEPGAPQAPWSLGHGATFAEAALRAALEYVALRTSLRGELPTRPVVLPDLDPALLHTGPALHARYPDTAVPAPDLATAVAAAGLRAYGVDVTPPDLAELTSTVAVRVLLAKDRGQP